jgi:hypothetical protein
MANFSASIDFTELHLKLDLIEQRMTKIEELLVVRNKKDADSLKPIPQKAAMMELGVSFRTFKELCLEFRVWPVIRRGRLFYRRQDLDRIIYGKK